MKLSLIIPVYNVEKYIKKCLDSCVNQNVTTDSYEIIIVNDGTQDNSVSIIDSYVKKYNNIRLIHRENGGLSAARNTGLAEAFGDYVWFIDSDDTIAEGSIAAVLTGLQTEVDILGIQYRLVYDDSTCNKVVRESFVDGIRDGKYVTIHKGIPIPVPFSVYKRKFLQDKHLFFAEGKLHEDSEFKPRAIYLADKISTIDYVCYNYYKGNNASITARHTYRNVDGYMYAASSIFSFCMNVDLKYKYALYREVGRCVNGAVFSYVHLTNSIEKKNSKKRIVEDKRLFHGMMKTKSLSYCLEAIFLIIAPSLFLFIYPKLKRI